MKKMILTLVAMLTIAVSARAMTYEQARNEALFLTDKMAYELNLSDAQYEAAYEINLDYLMGVTSQYDVFGPYWERRNLDLSYVLFSWQWDAFCAASYFYRPLFWEAGYWHFGIYARYPHRSYFYFGRPHFYNTYRGGHSWHMNGGRSFYEARRDHYRPGNPPRESHFGMRSGWDRGDYRGNNGRHSSTRVTEGNRGRQPGQPGGQPGGGYRQGAQPGSGQQQGGFGSERRRGSNAQPGGNGAQPGSSNAQPGGNGAHPGGNGAQPGNVGSQPQNQNRNGGQQGSMGSGRTRSGGGSFGGSRQGSSNQGGGFRQGGGSGAGTRSGAGTGSNSGSRGGHFGGGRR